MQEVYEPGSDADFERLYANTYRRILGTLITLVRDPGGEALHLSRWAGLGKRSPLVAGCFAFWAWLRRNHAARMSQLRKSPLTPSHVIWPVFSTTCSAG